MVRTIEKQVREPWLLMGDFNLILGAEERMQGRDVQDSETKDFREVVEECNLVELPTIGRSYTWTNSHVFSRIDKTLVNDKWMLNMPLRQKWKAGTMEDIWQNLKCVKAALKQLNSKEFMNVKQKIKSIREGLQEVQGRMKYHNALSRLFEEEREMIHQLEKWDKIEESIYKQKSRIQWIQLGTPIMFISLQV
ncbi:uncharacterized protein [Nicotiana sylvestris]|uniref:uncharacterized protein n=1 Tax=Nicotiana sylvestris TaxID=4096 RepID=UPI00388C63E0